MKLWQHGGTFRVKEDNDNSLSKNGTEMYKCLGYCDANGNLLKVKKTKSNSKTEKVSEKVSNDEKIEGLE